MDVKLIADCGPARGQAIDVRGKFFIGRDPHCQVKPGIPGLHGVHALVEDRQGQLFVRDCGSELGTTVNGRILHTREVEVFDGDRLSIGDLGLVFLVRPRDNRDLSSFSEVPEGWPFVPASQGSNGGANAPLVPAAPLAEEAAPDGSLSFEAPPPGDVLIVRPCVSDLNDEATVSPLRNDLHFLTDRPMPSRVVVDLDNVTYMSSRAVGVILSYYQRVTAQGGTLRVCRANPNVAPVLQQMRLDRMVDVYETLAEATETPWE